ncbi:TonB-dependent siderophore receptor [Sphingomonas oleivorans]|uniref:TonB-dependent siderophore receptor n=1 Tax=Sphingomonas oleivorans TaxID=1735121 RepID=A0A2T5FW53_9SPHN|nr:TonB-dependent siderophore receptor [Sphingomonas oleivorans]PTQ10011.1 TonB-dependent siderophore receptor [Sphingomonas oleivorans]
MNYVAALRSALCCGIASLVFTLPSAPAWAEEAEPATGDILVTGQRQAYRGDVALKDMPQAVSIIDSTLLKDAGITRLDTALDLSAGIARQNNYGGMWDAFAIRGFAGDENFPGGFLINGFNAGRNYSGPRDASNVERIEVLKGPNSALFGRGEPGGTINIVTKKPQFDTEGYVSVSGGSYNSWRGEGDVTTPISDKVAVRVNGAYEKGDSFRDTIEYEKYTVTPSILAKLDDDTSISYEFEYVHNKTPFDRGVVAVDGKLGAIPISRFLGEPGDGPMTIKSRSHQLQFQHDLSKDWGFLIGASYRTSDFSGFGTEALPAAYVTGTQQTVRRRRLFRDHATDNITIRGELSGTVETGSLVHHIVLGADWDSFEHDVLQQRANSTAAKPNAINIYNPVYGNLPALSRFRSELDKQENWGVYLMDQVDLMDRVKLRFGGRYDSFNQDYRFRYTNVITDQAVTKFSPQAGIVFEATDTLSFYGSYGRGFRPNSGAGATGAAFSPETSRSYEVGAKYSSPGGRITSTLALFSMKKNNILTADLANPSFSAAIGEAKSKGVEFDLTGKLPAGFKLWLSYSYIDAEVAKDIVDRDFGRNIPAGSRLLNVPKHSGNVMLMKDIPIGDMELTLGGGVQYVGTRLGEFGTQFELPDYTLARLTAALALTDNIKVHGEVNNLFDEDHYTASYSPNWVNPGMPRNFKVRLTYSF